MLRRRYSAIGRALPLIIVRVAGAGLAGVLAVYVARTQGAEYSGEFFYLVSTLTITSVITRLGAEPYLTSQVASRDDDDPRSRASYLFSTFVAVLSLVLMAGAMLWIVQAAAPALTDRLVGDVPIVLLVLAVLGLNTMWIVTGYCRALGMAGVSIFLETGLLSLWLLGLLLVTNRTTIEPTPSTVAVGVALMCPVLLVPIVPLLLKARHGLVSLSGIKHALVGVGSFGAVTVINGIIVLIPLQALAWHGLVEEAGVYNAALRVSMFVGASGVVVKSMIVRQEAQRTTSTHQRSHDVGRTAVIALPWIAVSVVVAWQGHLLSALFGSEFTAIEDIILVMLVAQSINVAGFLVETRAVLANERRLLNVTAAFTLLIALTTTPVLVDAFGLQGAAWAFATTITLSRGLMIWLYVRGPHNHPLPDSPGEPDTTVSARAADSGTRQQ